MNKSLETSLACRTALRLSKIGAGRDVLTLGPDLGITRKDGSRPRALVPALQEQSQRPLEPVGAGSLHRRVQLLVEALDVQHPPAGQGSRLDRPLLRPANLPVPGRQ